jgi:hypothetical protein
MVRTVALSALTIALVSLIACDKRTRVRGTVIDKDGNSVPSASVQLTLASTGRTAATTTPQDGSFSVELIHGPFARFELVVSKTGYSSYRQKIPANTDQRVRITLAKTETQAP